MVPGGDSLEPCYLLSFLMLFRFLSAASVVLGAFAPLPAEAKSSCGHVSHYGVGDGYHGQRAADGSRFDAYGLTVASPSLPFGTRLRVVNPANGKSVVVRVSDRGPFVHGRVLDLSFAAFARIANPSQGVARLCFARA
jgi:rare lipoprotein A